MFPLFTRRAKHSIQVHALLLKYLSRHHHRKSEHIKQDECLLIPEKIRQKALLLILAEGE